MPNRILSFELSLGIWESPRDASCKGTKVSSLPSPPSAAVLVRIGGPICIQNACASPIAFFSYLELSLRCVICKVDVIVIKDEVTSQEMKLSASAGYRLTSRSINNGLAYLLALVV